FTLVFRQAGALVAGALRDATGSFSTVRIVRLESARAVGLQGARASVEVCAHSHVPRRRAVQHASDHSAHGWRVGSLTSSLCPSNHHQTPRVFTNIRLVDSRRVLVFGSQWTVLEVDRGLCRRYRAAYWHRHLSPLCAYCAVFCP